MNSKLTRSKVTRPFAALLLAWLSIGLVPAYGAEQPKQVPTNEKPHGQAPTQTPQQPESPQRQKNQGRTDDSSEVKPKDQKQQDGKQQEKSGTMKDSGSSSGSGY